MNKKLIVLSHCILNSYSKVESFQEKTPFHKLAIDLLNEGYAIIQLPCPENIIYGQRRWGHVENSLIHLFIENNVGNYLSPIFFRLKTM